MSDLEKINIYVPEHVGNLLDNDASMFEILKRDGWTINRNRFFVGLEFFHLNNLSLDYLGYTSI